MLKTNAVLLAFAFYLITQLHLWLIENTPEIRSEFWEARNIAQNVILCMCIWNKFMIEVLCSWGLFGGI